VIRQSDLSKLSNRLAKDGGRRIPEIVLERDYCIAWFLASLSRSPLKSSLVFKGGTALKRCYFVDYRFSEDLDFTLRGELPPEKIPSLLEPTFKQLEEESGILFRYAREEETKHLNSRTFYLCYRGPLPATNRDKEIKVDITLKEEIVFPVSDGRVLKGYEEYADLPLTAKIPVYSLQEIASEKVLALLNRARNEPRDLYDLWYLVSGKHVVVEELNEAIEKKLEFRKKKLSDVAGEFRNKKARLQKLWENRLGTQVSLLPEFESVFREVQRTLRQAEIIR
jgi:predicted nucleotidyltransferase component of viral defense system